MITTHVDFLFFKLSKTKKTLHLVFTFDEKNSNKASISSAIQKIKKLGFNYYEIITKSNSHYIVNIENKIFDKYLNKLEIMSSLLEN